MVRIKEDCIPTSLSLATGLSSKRPIMICMGMLDILLVPHEDFCCLYHVHVCCPRGGWIQGGHGKAELLFCAVRALCRNTPRWRLLCGLLCGGQGLNLVFHVTAIVSSQKRAFWALLPALLVLYPQPLFYTDGWLVFWSGNRLPPQALLNAWK